MADCRARAAAGDAGDRLPRRRLSWGFAPFVTAFHHGVKESGYVEGQNVSIKFRWAMRSLSSVDQCSYCPEGQRP
jgi:hypothetical protein